MSRNVCKKKFTGFALTLMFLVILPGCIGQEEEPETITGTTPTSTGVSPSSPPPENVVTITTDGFVVTITLPNTPAFTIIGGGPPTERATPGMTGFIMLVTLVGLGLLRRKSK